MAKKNNQSRAPDLDKYIKQSKKHRYVSYYQGAQLYNMGYSLFVRTAKLAGANLPIRKTTLVDLNILDTYLEKDPSAHVAVKTVVKNNTVFAAGEHSYFLQAAVSDHSGGKPGRCREPRLPSRQHDPRIHSL